MADGAGDKFMTGPRAPARWQQIAAVLAEEIASLAPGLRLPTEAQLAARFEVNRHTVRRALDALVRQGAVRVEQGRGAFVAADLLDYTVSARTRFSEWVRRQNRVPAGQVLRLRELPAPAPVAAALDLAEAERVVLLERLGLADGERVALSDHYFALSILPGLTEALRNGGGISEALEAVGVDDYRRRSTRVAARLPNEVEADLLQISRECPLLVCENVNVDRTGRLIEFCVARYPSTRVQVVFEP